MQKIQITTDSTCDLSPELIKKYNVDVLPLSVITDDEHLDQVDLFPKDIFEYVTATKKLPKTAARSAYDFEELFRKHTDKGELVIHIGIGSELSASYRNACEAAKNVGEDKVFVVDSCSLSTGTGLLILAACDMASSEKYTAKEISETIAKRAPFVQASFVVETLDYLYKGGRCSALAMFGANLLKIKPRLQVENGKIVVSGKSLGKMVPVLKKYIDGELEKYSTPDTTRCFITHASADPALVAEIIDYVKSKNIFDEVLETVAGSTITCHCGQGTLGILYINDGAKQ